VTTVKDDRIIIPVLYSPLDAGISKHAVSITTVMT